MLQKILIASVITLIFTACTQTPTSNTSSGANEDTITTDNPIVLNTDTSYQTILAATAPTIANSAEFNACMVSAAESCIQTTGTELAREGQDASLCDMLPSVAQQDGCAFGVVLNTVLSEGNPDACLQIRNASYQASCFISYYSSQARTTGDVTNCDKIKNITASNNTDEENREYNREYNQCIISIVSSPSNTNAELCDLITDAMEHQTCTSMAEMQQTMQREMQENSAHIHDDHVMP